MNREVHVRICEGLGVKFPGPTRHGRSGPNRDYVLETVQALEALGYRETDLHLIAERLKGVHEAQIVAPSS